MNKKEACKPLTRAEGFKTGRKTRKEIFFNKKRREELRKAFLRGQKAILQNSDFSVKPFTEEEYAQRSLEASALAFTVTGLETIKKAEDFDKSSYLVNCKFYLFKKGKSVIIKATFLRPLLDSNLKTTFVYFLQGLPNEIKKKASVHKGNFKLEGCKLLDSGSFKQKILNFEEYTLKFKGKKVNLKIKLKLINEEKQSYWVTIL
ncbi:MAG: hypothetical protein Q8P26_01205 [Candidatus Levybacteria bacterium]|nr:hypothetical protein [Candidatus Levybacteria bacterium]